MSPSIFRCFRRKISTGLTGWKIAESLPFCTCTQFIHTLPLNLFFSLHLFNVLYFFIWWQMDVAIDKYFFLLIFRKLGFIQQCSHNFIFTKQPLESLVMFYRYTPSHPVFADPHKIRFAKRDSTLDIKFKCV